MKVEYEEHIGWKRKWTILKFEWYDVIKRDKSKKTKVRNIKGQKKEQSKNNKKWYNVEKTFEKMYKAP